MATARARDGSALAVADSQVVVLHRVEEGQTHSYRLKSSAGTARRLHYAHDSKALFYTEGLSHAVQMYCLREDSVKEIGTPHPSPVVAFAVSADSNLVLSASSDPPIVHLYNRTLTSTITILSKASEKSVIACAFHPTRKNVFLLAFNDGVLAAYDSTRLFPKSEASKKRTDVPQYADHIHKFVHLHDPSVAGSAGITGVHFIPGHRARAASVGEDGRLFIVDFEKRDVLSSWHVGAPITSLSVRETLNDSWLAAVGTVHGMCYVYDAEGNRISEQLLDPEGGKVLDVEWIYGEVKLPRETGLATNVIRDVDTTVKPLETSKTAQNVEKPPQKSPAKDKAPAIPETAPQVAELMYTKDYMSVFSPVKKAPPVPNRPVKKAKSTTEKPSELEHTSSKRSALSAPQTWDEKSPATTPTAELKKPTLAIPEPEKKLSSETNRPSLIQLPRLDPAKFLFAEPPLLATPKEEYAASQLLPSIPISPGPSASRFSPSNLNAPKFSPMLHQPPHTQPTRESLTKAATSNNTSDALKLLSEIRAIRGDNSRPAAPPLANTSILSNPRSGSGRNTSLIMDEAVRSGLRRGAGGRAKRPSPRNERKSHLDPAGDVLAGERKRGQDHQAEGNDSDSNASKKTKSVQWAEEQHESSMMEKMMDTLDGGVSQIVTSTPAGANFSLQDASTFLTSTPASTLKGQLAQKIVQKGMEKAGEHLEAKFGEKMAGVQGVAEKVLPFLTPELLSSVVAPLQKAQSTQMTDSLATLRSDLKDDLRSFSIDILKQFQAQRKLIENVQSEVKELRRENEVLKKMVKSGMGGGLGLTLGDTGGEGLGLGDMFEGLDGNGGEGGTDMIAFGL